MGVAAGYRACARVTRAEATNFYYAFLSLPRAQRRSVYALYAFCREADNAVDEAASLAKLPAEEHADGALPADGLPGHVDSEPDGGLLAEREVDTTEHVHAALRGLRERLESSAVGRPATLRDEALANTMARYGVRPADLDDVICGMEMDCTVSRYASYDELSLYCYRVASAVGLATLPILTDGAAPTKEMREHAVALGQGMQLVNILRDVAEDAARDRIYIPQDALRAFGVCESDIMEGRPSAEMQALLASVAARARDELANGRRLIRAVPARSRGCLWLLAELYGRILSALEKREFDVFSSRVSLPKYEKLLLLASTLWRRG